MTLPESTISKVAETLVSAEWLLRKIGESTEADKCQAALNILSAPPVPVGGLPEGLNGLRIVFGVHRLAPFMPKPDPRLGNIHEYESECDSEGCTPIEVMPQGTRDRLAFLMDFVEQEAGFDCDGNNFVLGAGTPCNACASCRARAILARDGVEGKG